MKTKFLFGCLVVSLAMLGTGCLEDQWKPIDETLSAQDIKDLGLKTCETPETWQCNGDVREFCRATGEFLIWRPMEDCGNIPGLHCVADGLACAGDYWVDGYCPGLGIPASTDCKEIPEVGCCNADANTNLSCVDGVLYCDPCWGDPSYQVVCSWDTKANYACMGDVNTEDNDSDSDSVPDVPALNVYDDDLLVATPHPNPDTDVPIACP